MPVQWAIVASGKEPSIEEKNMSQQQFYETVQREEEITVNHYEKLAAINVNEHVEKKQKFSYLSWVWAVDVLMRNDPDASWVYGEPTVFSDGTMMVYCTVTAFGKPRKMQLPVINHANKPIPNPGAFDVNTAMQRCLVKAIALHGLGLYIYAGEDLPFAVDEPEPEPTPELLASANDAAKSGLEAYKDFWKGISEQDRHAIGQKLHADFKLIAQDVKAAA